MTDRKPKILHLVDDATAGGVMRVVEFICNDARLGQTADHQIHRVKRGAVWPPVPRADVIVSHLSVSWSTLLSLFALRLRHQRTPLLHVEHSYTERFVALNVINRGRFRTLLRVAFSLFDRVICVSQGQTDWFSRRGFCAPDKLRRIRSCVDLAAFRALPMPARQPRTFAALGRLDKQKGFDTLIRAFRLCHAPDLRLHVIGEGAEMKALQKLAGSDSRIIFKGFSADPATALRDVDVVVMPSRWEAYGIVAIEALASGRKLLCNGVDGLLDHVPLGGQVVDTSSPTGLSAAITDQALARISADNMSPIRQNAMLEMQFRENWRALLQEVMAAAPQCSHSQRSWGLRFRPD